MVDRDGDCNTRYGGYAGYQLAFKRTKLIPRRTAAIDLVAIVTSAKADTAEKVVSRALPARTLADEDRAVLVGFLRDKIGTADSGR